MNILEKIIQQFKKRGWINKCAKRFIDKYGFSIGEAIPMAKECYEEIKHEGIKYYDPEYVADEEMTYWVD